MSAKLVPGSGWQATRRTRRPAKNLKRRFVTVRLTWGQAFNVAYGLGRLLRQRKIKIAPVTRAGIRRARWKFLETWPE